MRFILNCIRNYFREADKKELALTSALAGGLIFLNYFFKIDSRISSHDSFSVNFICRYFIFLAAFILPWLFYLWTNKKNYFNSPLFIFLILIAPAIFSLKVALNMPLPFSDQVKWNNYWNQVFYWPALLAIVVLILFIIRKSFFREQSFFGASVKNFQWKPYLLILLIMLPLISIASAQTDFQDMYPKIKLITGVYGEPGLRWWHKLLFELSYGSDFAGIELFFRGFLVLAFSKWAGKDAILPMTCFYCTIHFGKPLGECISSYFGGLILGIVVYNTRSIVGGLMVHLGIAWMMEIGGYIGNAVK